MNIVLLLVSLIVAPFLIAKVDLWRKKHLHEVLSWWSEENMPKELRNATLFLCEEDVATTLPVPLHGRVDQVFLSKKKVLIPLDTKLRKDNRIFESDVIQLSVYRVILKNQYNLEVSDYGYVRTVVPQPDGKNKVRYIRTKLLNEKKVVSLYYKYQAIRQGLRRPVRVRDCFIEFSVALIGHVAVRSFCCLSVTLMAKEGLCH